MKPETKIFLGILAAIVLFAGWKWVNSSPKNVVVGIKSGVSSVSKPNQQLTDNSPAINSDGTVSAFIQANKDIRQDLKALGIMVPEMTGFNGMYTARFKPELLPIVKKIFGVVYVEVETNMQRNSIHIA